MSMIDKVAQAIADNIVAGLPEGVTIDARYAAVAAIEAMRDPSSGTELSLKRWMTHPSEAKHAWSHIIDGMLFEK